MSSPEHRIEVKKATILFMLSNVHRGADSGRLDCKKTMMDVLYVEFLLS